MIVTYPHPTIFAEAAFGKEPYLQRANYQLTRDDRTILVSPLTLLELTASSVALGRVDVAESYSRLLSSRLPAALPTGSDIFERAMDLVYDYRLLAAEALHIAFALECAADEFLTIHPPTHPIYSVAGINVRSLRGEDY